LRRLAPHNRKRANAWRSTPFIAGRYSATFNAVDVGITEDGYELQFDTAWEMINQSDAYGDSIIDGIFRGGSVYLQYLGLAYKAGSITPFFPWGALGQMQVIGTTPIGRLASAVGSSMVLTSTAGTPAATSPATATFLQSILAPNNPARLLYSSRLRKVPTRLLALPYAKTATDIRWWEQT
jgi:hypothetical protein